jgi:hypothetical protein
MSGFLGSRATTTARSSLPSVLANPQGTSSRTCFAIAIHRGPHRIWQVYLWVTRTERCWETRDLSKDDRLLIANDKFSNTHRDFTKYLNAWGAIARLNQ